MAAQTIAPGQASDTRSYQPQARNFRKEFHLESFGFSSSGYAEGFENASRLSGAGEAVGLQCPYCIIRPALDRTRYTLPAFAGRAVWNPIGGRTEVATGQGAVNAYRPDNSLIVLDRRTSFNNDWLLQHWGSAAYALDAGKHFWLGGLGRRTVRTNAENGPSKSRKSAEGTLNLLWGR